MLEVIKMYFLSSVFVILTAIYLQSRILNKKIVFNFINVIYLLLLMILCIINYIFVNSFLRFFSITILICLFSSLILKESLFKTFIASIIQQFLAFISELFYMLLFSLLSINLLNVSIDNTIFLTVINLIICLTSIFIYEIRYIQTKIKKILKMFDKLKYINVYLILLFFLVTLNFLLTSNYIIESNALIALINVIFIIIYSIILIVFMFEKKKTIMYLEKNKALLSNLNEYEKMLDYQRVSNHENKNQLLVIKSMIEKKDKDVLNYIDEIIKDKREDNEILYNQAKKIPSGGLQGLIYQKMLLIQEKNINLILDVSNEVRKMDFSTIPSKMNYDICRIIGIILDNAIEATIKLNEENKEILISMYIDEYFIIEISNRFIGEIDINKIFNKGYTTKEKGHGYGLNLLRKIVNENDNIINEVKVTNNIFTQIIKIKTDFLVNNVVEIKK